MNRITELLTGKGLLQIPALITVRCGDPRHNNRHVLAVTREHYLRDVLGDHQIDELQRVWGLKRFNIISNEAVPNFDVTSAGGRWSPAITPFIEIARDVVEMELVRIYAGEHESSQCKAAKYGKRLDWEQAIRLTLSELETANTQDLVDIYRYTVATQGSSIDKFDHIAQYGGQKGTTVITTVPVDDF